MVNPMHSCSQTVDIHQCTCNSSVLYLIINLNAFLGTLDKRYENKVIKAGGTVARKVRVIGAPSSTPIPLGTPAWMIDADFQGK